MDSQGARKKDNRKSAKSFTDIASCTALPATSTQ